jgi:glutamate-ammonia-ligase adenylyltransferase
MADGRLYEVDMRLRPSGRQGPIATSVAAFDSYQRTEAWTWEHLALTRARAIAGSETLGQKVEAIRRAVLTDKATGPNIRGDVADMRDRIASAKTGHGAWEAKIGAGRLQDVELSVQTATLLAGSDARTTADQIAAGVAAGLFDAADGAALTASADLYWRLQMSAKLLTGDKVDPQALGEGGRRFILRETGHDTFDALGQTMAQTAAAANAAIARLLDRDQTDDDGQD